MPPDPRSNPTMEDELRGRNGKSKLTIAPKADVELLVERLLGPENIVCDIKECGENKAKNGEVKR